MPKMGKYDPPRAGLANALLSRVQLRLLALLFGQPERSFHASELIRLAASGSGAVQRELEKLSAAGILTLTVSGNRKLYQANRQCPIFQELHGLIVKTVGLIEPLKAALEPYSSHIDAAFVYGSIAKGKDTATSDVDLMIVGRNLAYGELYLALQKAEKTLRRPVNPNLMSKGEWVRKRADKTSFVNKILQQPKLFVFGTEHELRGA